MSELRDILYNAGLENSAENLVFQELSDYVEKVKNETNPPFCVCSICLADVAAIVLNDLKPSYSSNFIDKDKRFEYYSKYRSQVQRKIIEAFEVVKKNPHHGK
ncbi:MAG TPA: late competence development ComFB family protein [Acetivibrio sp.]|nr:late competence development ComFB family protein [Clostridium sp.]HPT91150.1 late competence development ComFB family protein [Acetivibrio sp.]HQA58443.1 late competence development ComFB family protein [Acetivibrio sp.]